MKKILAVSLCCVIILTFSLGSFGCINKTYRGEYKELYSVAVYSIPDADGYIRLGEISASSQIYIWEQDDYGRTLFAYCEDADYTRFALVIAQAYDETNVYFYPDRNYVITQRDTEYSFEGEEDDHLMNSSKDFYLKNKDKLKEANDWNKPLDKTKCVSYKITDRKYYGKYIYSFSKSRCNEILDEYSETLNLPNPENGPHRLDNVLQVDAEGKILHEIYGLHRRYDIPNWGPGDEENTYYIVLWVITDSIGNYDKENGILVMYSKANDYYSNITYNAEDILEFKNKNNWKDPYCSE